MSSRLNLQSTEGSIVEWPDQSQAKWTDWGLGFAVEETEWASKDSKGFGPIPVLSLSNDRAYELLNYI